MGIPVLLCLYEGATRARKMRSILRSERGTQSAEAERNLFPDACLFIFIGRQPAYEEAAERIPSSHGSEVEEGATHARKMRKNSPIEDSI